MLKRLELVGFKSFADRTVFDFSEGITAIVGPNGSGKSNVVDAIKWVLGEQSAKSLRGSEMADVIFNGSASRRGLGMAEVTLTFDNRRRQLATEAEEIQITRRVYRSGESEYLINQHPCRLKDIRDLFLGSGAGTDAYCIIEQGRVDVLLQASTRERRTIFEEAAGISRFKARKIESLRKLERVEQNLQRLKDVLDEVDKQLRSVRLQAAKAQRYQEYTQQLRELRLGLGLQEYHTLAGQLSEAADTLQSLRQALTREMGQAGEREKELAEIEEQLARLEASVHQQEEILGEAKSRLAAARSTLEHEAASADALAADLDRDRLRLAGLNDRCAELSAAVRNASQELDACQDEASRRKSQAEELERLLALAGRRLARLRQDIETGKSECLEANRQAGRLQNEVITHRADLDAKNREHERLRLKSDQAADELAGVERRLQELAQVEQEIQEQLAGARQALSAAREQQARLGQLREETSRAQADLRAERRGLAGRIEVLEGLERSHEGLGTGVREVLDLMAQPEPGPWHTVLGVVAELLTVRREYAPLIDLALGERAQAFVVLDPSLLQTALAARQAPFSGRVAFVPLAVPGSNRLLEHSTQARVRMPTSPEGVPNHPGVVALAEQLARCADPQLADLPRQLLARTLVVRDLETARTLAAHTSGYRFVTLQGELLEPDGTLTVGTHHAEAGVLSRKSELRELRERVLELDAHLEDLERQLTELSAQQAGADLQVSQCQGEVERLGEQAADLRSRLAQQRESLQKIQDVVAISQHDMTSAEREIAALQSALARAQEGADRALEEARQTQERVAQLEAEARNVEEERGQLQNEATRARMDAGHAEERAAGLRQRLRQVEKDLFQRLQERQEAERLVADLAQRLCDSEMNQLRASAELALACHRRQGAEHFLAETRGQRDALRSRRQELSEKIQSSRQSWQSRQAEIHSQELAVSELRHRLSSLVGRLREDYQIDLEELYRQRAEAQNLPVLEVRSANEEIEELRKKLSRLGSVNLEALQELQELEARHGSLQTQYDDLVAARKTLDDVIERINTDSRRLFLETLTAVKGHFQELFRKLFAGGQADVLLEDESDVLESGIEIVARPPGKELRSISLMSGGEKTLTAVALLLAIFRSKPSPFCVLDEVDAALDEANVGRLSDVLREFLNQSQFILITHSKRTMAGADVLCGVTMQESGVSRRIAIRFEDWPEDSRQGQAAAA